MDLTGQYRIPAPRGRVWDALNDPDVLRACIPGCKVLEKQSDNQFAAKAVAKVGPVQATFAGAVTLSELDPPRAYRITGQGQGGVAGYAKGGAVVTLTDDGPEATILNYEAKADVGGKLASIGNRLIQAASKKMADDFFAAFVAAISPREELAAERSVRPEPATSRLQSSPEALPVSPRHAEAPRNISGSPVIPLSEKIAISLGSAIATSVILLIAYLTLR